jgi:hypothetical protein
MSAGTNREGASAWIVVSSAASLSPILRLHSSAVSSRNVFSQCRSLLIGDRIVGASTAPFTVLVHRSRWPSRSLIASSAA